MTRRPTLRWRVIVALWLLAACTGEQPDVLRIDRQVTLFPASDSAALHDRTIDSLTRIVDVVLHDSVLVLTDSRQRRIAQVIPGRTGTLQGRRGDGPGEFQFPLHSDALGDRVVIGDIGNSRFQFYNREGELTATFKSPVIIHHFALESDSTLLVAMADSVWYLARVNMRGDWQPVARRPVRHRTQRSEAPAALMRYDHLVAMLGHGSFAVFDQADGMLREYDAQGEMVRQRSLPTDLLQRLVQARDEDMKALSSRFGGVLTAPLVKELAGDHRGHLLLLMSAAPIGGLWLDVNRNQVVALTTDAPRRDDPLLSATAGTVSGDRIALASFDGSVRLRRLAAPR